MEDTRNLRYLGECLSNFFNCPLTREVFPAIGNLTLMFPIVVLPICISIRFDCLMCCLYLYLFCIRIYASLGKSYSLLYF